MRVLVFGASITQGYWDTQGGWVQRLRTHYDKKQIADLTKDNPSVFNLGVSADTTKDILERFEAETKARSRKKFKNCIIVRHKRFSRAGRCGTINARKVWSRTNRAYWQGQRIFWRHFTHRPHALRRTAYESCARILGQEFKIHKRAHNAFRASCSQA